MPPGPFFRRHLGIFASIGAHCAAFAAEMRRNSGGIHCVEGQGAARGGSWVAGLIAMVSARRLEGQRLREEEDGEGEEDVFGIAAARVGKFLRLIQTKRMG